MNNSRLKTVLSTFYLIFGMVILKFFYYQVVKYDYYHHLYLSQSQEIKEIIPTRGNIFDSKNIPLTVNTTTYQLSLYKPNSKDLSKSLDQFNQQNISLDLNDQKLLENFKSDNSLKWITLNKTFTFTESQNLNDPLFSFQTLNQRIYPYQEFTAQITGQTKTKDGVLFGISGLENYYQKILSGKSGFGYYRRDATGNTIISENSWENSSQDGQDIHTSISLPLQTQSYQILEKGIIRYQADSGAIIVMDSKTGNILSLVSLDSTSSAKTQNRILTDIFEPGSIYKPLVMAAALNEKKISENWTCPQCDRQLTVGEYVINNWDKQFHPSTNIFDTIKNSDNIAMSQIIKTLGLEKYLTYHELFGFNQRTGIDLQGEIKPPIKKYWPTIDFYSASFGQGFAITPIQFITAFNTLANKGVLVGPRISPDASRYSRAIFSPDTANLINHVLEYATKNSPPNQFNTTGLSVCAKSGTAQIASLGKYSDKTNASYVGFFPCSDPKFTIFVTLNNPRLASWGSSSAAPLWYETALVASSLL